MTNNPIDKGIISDLTIKVFIKKEEPKPLSFKTDDRNKGCVPKKNSGEKNEAREIACDNSPCIKGPNCLATRKATKALITRDNDLTSIDCIMNKKD